MNLLNVSESSPSVGVFVTPQSVVAFPVAATSITVIWQVFTRIWPELIEAKWLVLIIAFLVGGIVYLASDVPKTDETTYRDVILAIFCFIVNSCFLAATALGIISIG